MNVGSKHTKSEKSRTSTFKFKRRIINIGSTGTGLALKELKMNTLAHPLSLHAFYL